MLTIRVSGAAALAAAVALLLPAAAAAGQRPHGVSTVGDVARFYRALLGGGLLAQGLLREALGAVPTGRPGRGYGLGLDVRDSPYGPLVGHDGDVPGFSIEALSDRHGRRQAVVAVNMKFAAPAVDAAFDEAVDAAGRLAFGG